MHKHIRDISVIDAKKDTCQAENRAKLILNLI